MIFLLDENFPKAAVAVLENYGHSVHDVRGTALEGAEDHTLLEEAQRLGAVLLSTDRDFFHTLRHLYPQHAGLIVIALKQPSRASIIGRLQWLLENVPEHQLPGRAFQLRDDTWIIQPPLA